MKISKFPKIHTKLISYRYDIIGQCRQLVNYKREIDDEMLEIALTAFNIFSYCNDTWSFWRIEAVNVFEDLGACQKFTSVIVCEAVYANQPLYGADMGVNRIQHRLLLFQGRYATLSSFNIKCAPNRTGCTDESTFKAQDVARFDIAQKDGNRDRHGAQDSQCRNANNSVAQRNHPFSLALSLSV